MKNMNVISGMLKDKKKQGNHQKQFAFVAGSCTCFQSFGVHNIMNAKSAIEKLQRIRREKEAQRSEHRTRHEEQVELLRRIEVEEELRRAKK